MLDGLLCEQFGWTLDELDEQDDARLLQTVQALNVLRSLQRCARAIAAQQHPAEGDLELWGWAMGYTDNA